MKIEIKNRWTLAVMFECEADSMKLAVELAVSEKVNLAGAYLAGADLAGAYLAGADLAGAYLAGAYLARAYLAGADLAGADLARANLAGADLAGAYLAGAYLARAYLAGADLAGAYLARANLAGADLAGADLAGADLAGAYLARANLARANLAGAKYGDYPMTIRPLQIFGLYWDVLILDTAIKIGCHMRPIDAWNKFTDAEISGMDGYALTFWKEHKALIMSAARLHAAKAAKQEAA